MTTDEMMNAVYADVRGGPEQLRYGLLRRPTPVAGEVLIEVHAAAITFAELTWDETWRRRPAIVSHEISGVVASAGSGASDWSPGDEVFALIRFERDGGAAQYVTVPADDVAAKPTSVDHIGAAAVPLAGLTAWQALFDHGHLKSGDRVLIHGGAGGVGSFAVQLAVNHGAHVTATARSGDVELLRDFGAHVVIDYEHDRFDAAPAAYDVVLDTVSGETLSRSYGVVRPGGTVVTLAAPPDQQRATECGITAVFFIVTPNQTQLRELATLIDAGELTVPIAATYPLENGRAAFEDRLLPTRKPGKTVLVVRD